MRWYTLKTIHRYRWIVFYLNKKELKSIFMDKFHVIRCTNMVNLGILSNS